MIFPDVTKEEWIKKYPSLSQEGLEQDYCGCGRQTNFEIPYIDKGAVGLMAKECPCGEYAPGFHEFPTDKKVQEQWKNLFKTLENL